MLLFNVDFGKLRFHSKQTITDGQRGTHTWDQNQSYNRLSATTGRNKTDQTNDRPVGNVSKKQQIYILRRVSGTSYVP